MRPAHVLLLADNSVCVFDHRGARMPRLEGAESRQQLRELAEGATVQRQVGEEYVEVSRWAL